MIEVRLIEGRDMGPGVDMVMAQIAETEPHQSPDPDRVRSTIARSVQTGDPTVFVAEKDGEVIGYIMGSIQGYRYQAGLFTLMEALYVRPENRGSRAAAKLIREFIRWGDMLGTREQFFGVSNGYNDERTARLFECFGARRCGAHMRRAA